MNVLILMQGAIGSGKSTVAETLKEMLWSLGHECRICSTDKLFEVNGIYTFDPTKISENHLKNQKICRQALEFGESVIVDNTNTCCWEAKPYVQMAQELGVQVFFVPCHGRFSNVHGVPADKVEAMRNRCEPLSVEACLASKAPWEK